MRPLGREGYVTLPVFAFGWPTTEVAPLYLGVSVLDAARRGLRGDFSGSRGRLALGLTGWVRNLAGGDVELEARLYTKPNTTLPVDRVPIDLQWVHREMRRKAMTLQLLWVEYRDAARHDDKVRKPYQYSQFCAPRRGRRMARMASALTSLSSHLAVGSRASDYGESACCRERGWAMMEARTV